MRSLLKLFIIIALLLIPSFSFATKETKTAAPMGDQDSEKTSIVAQLTDELDKFDQYHPELLSGEGEEDEVTDDSVLGEAAQKHLETCIDLFKKASHDEKAELKDNFYFLLLTARTGATLTLLKHKKDSFEDASEIRKENFFKAAETFLTTFKELLAGEN